MVLIPLKLYYISLDGLCNLVRIDFFPLLLGGGVPLMQMNYDASARIRVGSFNHTGIGSVLNKCFFCVSTADYGKI